MLVIVKVQYLRKTKVIEKGKVELHSRLLQLGIRFECEQYQIALGRELGRGGTWQRFNLFSWVPGGPLSVIVAGAPPCRPARRGLIAAPCTHSQGTR